MFVHLPPLYLAASALPPPRVAPRTLRLSARLPRARCRYRQPSTQAAPYYRKGCNAGGGPDVLLAAEPGPSDTALAQGAGQGQGQGHALAAQRLAYVRGMGAARFLDLAARVAAASEEVPLSLPGTPGGWQVPYLRASSTALEGEAPGITDPAVTTELVCLSSSPGAQLLSRPADHARCWARQRFCCRAGAGDAAAGHLVGTRAHSAPRRLASGARLRWPRMCASAQAATRGAAAGAGRRARRT